MMSLKQRQNILVNKAAGQGLVRVRVSVRACVYARVCVRVRACACACACACARPTPPTALSCPPLSGLLFQTSRSDFISAVVL